MITKNGGFTLIEVITAITLFSIIIIPLFNLVQINWKLWQKYQEKLVLRQQARMISLYLEKDIKRAIDVKIIDIDGDDETELLLNLGENGGSQDDTDENTNYYLQYNIKSRKLTIKKPLGSFEDSGVSYPDWPEKSDWSYNRSVTVSIIKSCQFLSLKMGKIVNYKFKLKKYKYTYVFENKIHPLLY